MLPRDTWCITTAIKNVAAAGAIAAVVYRVDDQDPLMFVFSTPPAVPVFQIWKTAGLALLGLPDLKINSQAVIDPTESRFPVDADRITLFTSLGPSNDLELKPDLVAPGSSIYSALQMNDQLGSGYSLEEFGVADGTSFSAPMVAGASALLKQAHPTWTPLQIKSALASTANPNVTLLDGATAADIVASGAGRLDIAAAMNAGVVFEPTGVSFSNRLLAEKAELHRPLRITNTATATTTFTIAVKPRAKVSGGSVTVAPAALALAPGQSGTVDISYAIAPPAAQPQVMDGRLQVTASTGATFSVPYWGRQVPAFEVEYIAAIRGNGQTVPVSSALPRNLAAQVYDSEFVPVAGVPVKFQVVSGQAKLSADSVTTDASGVAAISVQMPGTPGPVDVTASVSADIEDTFYLTARPSPAIGQGGIVNAASYVSGVAPGGIISIFGTGLAAGTESAQTMPMPSVLASTQVLFNGKPAPLFFVSPGQINAMAPFELSGVATAEMRISVKGALSPPVKVQISEQPPGDSDHLARRPRNAAGAALLRLRAGFRRQSRACGRNDRALCAGAGRSRTRGEERRAGAGPTGLDHSSRPCESGKQRGQGAVCRPDSGAGRPVPGEFHGSARNSRRRRDSGHADRRRRHQQPGNAARALTKVQGPKSKGRDRPPAHGIRCPRVIV